MFDDGFYCRLGWIDDDFYLEVLAGVHGRLCVVGDLAEYLAVVGRAFRVLTVGTDVGF